MPCKVFLAYDMAGKFSGVLVEVEPHNVWLGTGPVVRWAGEKKTWELKALRLTLRDAPERWDRLGD